MSDEYLWDRTGSDEEVERLERLLEPMALKPHAAPRPATARRSLQRLAMAAIAAAMLVTVVWVAVRPTAPARPRTIDLGTIGRVEVEANAVVRVVRQSSELIKLRLERGTIHARISAGARPRLFQVETPAATCVDLGCKYTLTVDAAGRSVVRVETGRVAFVDGAREVFIPAGASCRAAPDSGSGTPVWDDAFGEIIEAVRAFDESKNRVEAAWRLASMAREKDTLSLWHLLQDPEGAVREISLDAIARLTGTPEWVERERLLKREPEALEELRDYLWRWHW